MIDPYTVIWFVAMVAVTVASLLAILMIYLAVRYVPKINRIFLEQPMFFPLRLTPKEKGEHVEFQSEDGVPLVGTYLKARTEGRSGVMVFCHEFLSNRWACQGYLDSLRDLGFDIFSFDFRNHGDSGKPEGYKPSQWLTNFEVGDLRAALAYLRTRPDHDPAGFGLFGVSRGANAALVVAAEQSDVWGVVTDGAFPTRGTMYAYIMKWAQIYITAPSMRKAIPAFCYHYVSWMARLSSQRTLGCKFPDVERAVAKFGPRPWLAIHGEKDTYIGPAIAKQLFDCAKEPKELWIVPGAKHNRCREREPEAYAARLLDFADRYSPRRLVLKPTSSKPAAATETANPARSIPISRSLITGVEVSGVNGEVARHVS